MKGTLACIPLRTETRFRPRLVLRTPAGLAQCCTHLSSGTCSISTSHTTTSSPPSRYCLSDLCLPARSLLPTRFLSAQTHVSSVPEPASPAQNEAHTRCTNLGGIRALGGGRNNRGALRSRCALRLLLLLVDSCRTREKQTTQDEKKEKSQRREEPAARTINARICCRQKTGERGGYRFPSKHTSFLGANTAGPHPHTPCCSLRLTIFYFILKRKSGKIRRETPFFSSTRDGTLWSIDSSSIHYIFSRTDQSPATADGPERIRSIGAGTFYVFRGLHVQKCVTHLVALFWHVAGALSVHDRGQKSIFLFEPT